MLARYVYGEPRECHNKITAFQRQRGLEEQGQNCPEVQDPLYLVLFYRVCYISVIGVLYVCYISVRGACRVCIISLLTLCRYEIYGHDHSFGFLLSSSFKSLRHKVHRTTAQIQETNHVQFLTLIQVSSQKH